MSILDFNLKTRNLLLYGLWDCNWIPIEIFPTNVLIFCFNFHQLPDENSSKNLLENLIAYHGDEVKFLKILFLLPDRR